MDIVFNVNYLGLEGLGATLASLVNNCSNHKRLKCWFLISGLEAADKKNIIKQLDLVGFAGAVEFIEFNAQEKFGHLPSLHGDWTTYGRLLIPEVVHSEYAVYLDSDLVVDLDILELEKFYDVEIFSAVSGCSVEWALDGVFLINSLKWEPDTSYFNAGILVFNLEKWRKEDYDMKIKQLAERYPKELISHDQTLLNAVSQGAFFHVPPQYNLHWYPGQELPQNISEAIIHFVGAPKPWDYSGKFIHSGYHLWRSYTSPFWYSQYSRLSASKLARTWQLKKSIYKHLRKRLLGIKN